MTQKEKQLLMQDLCARLSYGVKGKVETTDGNGKEIKDEGVLNSVFINEYGKAYICIEGMEYELEGVKPYLRPMSSMTEGERLELSRLTDNKFKFYLYTTKPEIICYEKYNYLGGLKVLDWLNAHHFDYRGLIGMGLAFEAPEGMYNI